jgi:protein tyrosine/serine phosphatase
LQKSTLQNRLAAALVGKSFSSAFWSVEEQRKLSQSAQYQDFSYIGVVQIARSRSFVARLPVMIQKKQQSHIYHSFL